MNEPPPAFAAAATPPLVEKSPAGPLFLWLVIQLIALAMAVFRVPLSARFPPPGEQFAIHIMLFTQVAAPALLFPFLMRDVTTSAMVILSIVPFVQLSSYLSSVPLTRAALGGLYVASWLLTLACWRIILNARRGDLFGVTCACAYALGGFVIWYTRAEARDAAPIEWSRDALFGPILGAIAQLHGSPSSSWIAAASLLIPSAVIAALLQNREVGGYGTPLAAL